MNNKIIINYQDILMSLPQPVFVTGCGGVVRLINTAGQYLMTGLGVTESLGSCIVKHIPHQSFMDVYEDIRVGDKIVGTVDFSLDNPYLAIKQYFTANVSKVEISDKILIVVVLSDMTSQRQADKMRSDFIANANHELRTPLSSIVGFVETLQNGALEERDTANKFLSIMAKESKRMARVLDDLLSLSRIEQDEHIVPDGTVDLKKTLHSIAEGLDFIGRAKNISFSFDLKGNTVVNGEGDQLTQVFQNLMSNAIKYGNRDSVVSIKTHEYSTERGKAVKVAISDCSGGIEEKHLSRLTERFYRVDKARSRKEDGTGLGLAIVKHIVSHHRGVLEIESVLGIGSVFSVILPVRNV